MLGIWSLLINIGYHSRPWHNRVWRLILLMLSRWRSVRMRTSPKAPNSPDPKPRPTFGSTAVGHRTGLCQLSNGQWCSPKCHDMPPAGGALVSHNGPAFDEGRSHIQVTDFGRWMA
jgi:hypothetical protein